MRYLKILGIAVLLGALFTTAAFSQAANGRLSVSISDSTGGTVPGAEVTVTSQATGRSYTGISSDLGNLTFPSLLPGLYEVRVSLDGFKTYVARDLKIDVAEEYSLKVTLEVGSLNDEVTVIAGADLVSTTDTQISSTIQKRQIDDLPLQGRNPVQLVSLHAGVAANTNANTAISGIRTSGTNLMIDGVNINDNFIRTNATTFSPNRLTQSMVGEFTITTQNQNSSSGFGSAQVAFVTPSGGNEFSGELYWVHRNDAASAQEFFDNLAGNEAPNLIRNQFGFVASGPIVKDKLFFYGNYEGFRERLQNSLVATVPTADARQGIFRYNDTNTGELREVNLLDLASGLTGVQLAVDPTVQGLFQLLPTQFNDPTAGDGLNTGGFRFNATSNEDRDQFGFRLDYNLDDNHTFEGIYRHNEVTNDRPDFAVNVNSPEVVGQTDGPLDFFSTAWKWTASPTLLNELRFGANLTEVTFNVFQDRPGGVKFDLASSTNPITNSETQGRITNTWQIADNVSWQRENHSFRFGFQSQFVRVESFASFNLFPEVNLGVGGTDFELAASNFGNNISAADLATANNLLADVAGIIDGVDREFNIADRTSGFQSVPNVKNWEYNIYAFYFGDSWRIHPRVNLNLGLRWEYYTPLSEADDLITTPVIQNGDPFATVLDPNAVVDFLSGDLTEKDYNNWAPSVGLAWDIFGDGRTSLRTNYSIAYINDNYIRSQDNAINRFGVSANASTLPNLGALLSNGVPAVDAPEFQLPLTWPQINNPASPFFVDAFPAAFVVDPEYEVPYTQSWSLGLEREIGWDTAVEVRYAGTRGTKLTRAFDLNQVIINENGFLDDFLKAQQNLELSRAFDGGVTAAFRPEVPGSQPLPVFDNLVNGGFLNNGAVISRLEQDRVGALVDLYNQNGLCGSVQCVPNPEVFVADVTTNGSDSTYHAFQIEGRRNFQDGLLFNMNYTFSKAITNFGGAQTNFEPILDLGNPDFDRGRAIFDITHIFNTNFIYELPFGSGKRWDFGSGLANTLLGGWQVTSIFSWQTGDPFSILSNRGTLNRDGRSNGRNRASTNLDNSGVRDLLGVGSNENGPFFIAPESLDQFSNPGAGELGSLGRFAFNGPELFNWDFGAVKRTRIREDLSLEFRAEFFNFTNRANFGFGNGAQTAASLNINANGFGRITGLNTAPRITQFTLKLNFF